jgi:uncharacterized protein (TIGR02147 family)
MAYLYLKYMSLYQYKSYTEALAARFKQRKLSSPGLTLSGLAQQCMMQASYLTNVLKERADLNSDQLYRLCELLGLDVDEADYMQLLLELKKTGYDKRRRDLDKKIDKIQRSNLRAEKNISTPVITLKSEQAERYYLDPHIQIVHIYLSIPKAKKTLEDLAQKFSLSHKRMAEILKVLQDIGYIRKTAKAYELLVSGRHLPRESPLLRPHQQLLRLKSLEQILSLSDESVYSFSATISTSPETRSQLQNEFLKFLNAAEKLVKKSNPEKLYQINFDLFPWEKESL